MAWSPRTSSDACWREASGSSMLMSAPERPIVVRVFVHRVDVAGGRALDDGEREPLVLRAARRCSSAGRGPVMVPVSAVRCRLRRRRPSSAGRSGAGGGRRRSGRGGDAGHRPRRQGHRGQQRVLDLDRPAALRALRLGARAAPRACSSSNLYLRLAARADDDHAGANHTRRRMPAARSRRSAGPMRLRTGRQGAAAPCRTAG